MSNKQRNRPAWSYKGVHFLYRFVLFWAWLFFKLFYRNQVYGLEHYIKGAGIIAPNHTSFLDPPLASISWPEEVHFLARQSLFNNRLFGAFIRALNAHPVSGGGSDAGVFKSITALLKEGKKVILFPEGIRSKNGKLGEIKPGMSLLISRSDAAIIPTYLHGTYEIWGRGRRLPKLWGKTACVFGSPIYWKLFASMEKKKAHEALAAALHRAIEDLRAWYEAGAKGTPP
jgi:1-acyl-sn-glycerol-3-phosphate acyltransferase